MRLSVPAFAAGAVAATLFVAVPAAALVSAVSVGQHPTTYDGTSPALTLSPTEFRVGSSIDAAPAPAPDVCSTSNFDIPLRLRWSGSDTTSALAGYDVWGAGPLFGGVDKLVVNTSATTYALEGYNYQGDCGGGSDVDQGFWVVAEDNRGNTASSNLVSPFVNVWQETGAYDTGEPGLTVTRTGTWTTASCICFNNGKTLYSTRAGASLSYRISTTRPGQTVAVVMEKNTNRGR